MPPSAPSATPIRDKARPAPPPAPAERDTSDFRFSIRALLLLTVAVAIVAAILGYCYRRLDASGQQAALGYWLTCAFFTLLGAGYSVWTRIQLERAAGPTAAARLPAGTWFRKVRPWRAVAAGSFFVLLALYYLVLISAFPSDEFSGSFLVSGFVGFLLATGIRIAWWNRRIQIRQHGLLRGLRLVRWSHVTRYHWNLKDLLGDNANDGYRLYVEGVDQWHKDIHLAIYVEDAERHTMEVFLNRVSEPWRAISRGDNTRYSRWPPFPIRRSEDVSTNRIIAAVLVVFVLIAVLSLARFRGVSSPFVFGAFLGGVGLVIAHMRRRWSSRRSSTPLIRLRTRVDWRSFALAALVLMATYLIEQHLPFFMNAVSFLLGVVGGLCIVRMYDLFSHEQFDLCQDGVALMLAGYWPWSDVQLLRWNNNEDGRLILRCGRRRLIARVPENHWDAVDPLLREKLVLPSIAEVAPV